MQPLSVEIEHQRKCIVHISLLLCLFKSVTHARQNGYVFFRVRPIEVNFEINVHFHFFFSLMLSLVQSTIIIVFYVT